MAACAAAGGRQPRNGAVWRVGLGCAWLLCAASAAGSEPSQPPVPGEACAGSGSVFGLARPTASSPRALQVDRASIPGLRQIGVTPGYEDAGWSLLVTAAFFLANFSGDASVRGAGADVDAPSSFVLDNQESGALVHVELSNDVSPVGLLFEVDYLELEGVDRPQAGLVENWKFKQVSTELGGFYSLIEEETRLVEILGGARYTRLENEVIATTDSSRTSFKIEPDWIDPFVGGRYLGAVARGVVVGARADIGGFGAGSDFTWNVQGGVGLLTGPGIVSLQYKYLKTDYKDEDSINRFTWDVAKHGVLLGFGLIF